MNLLIWSNKKGVALIAIYLVVVVLLILGSAFMSRSIGERRNAEKNKKLIQASYIAEAGLQRALSDLKADFDSGTTWDDGGINGLNVTVVGPPSGPNTDNYYSLPYTNTTLGNGSYTVELKNVPEGTDSNSNSIGDDRIWVKSTGVVDEVQKTIRVYAKTENISPWNNAISLSGGASGHAINGNVAIRGSVHILGEEPFVDENGNGVYDTGEAYTVIIDDGAWGRALASDDLAFDMGGSANIGNNYSGMSTSLSALIVDPPETTFGGETVETLNAKLRLKYGLAGFSGSATAGQSDVSGDSDKETLDGVYVTEGYGGNKGADNVYSDNSTSNSYDLTNEVRFPSLRDYYLDTSTFPATEYLIADGGYQKYLKDNADLTISGDLTMTPTSTDFDYYNETTLKGIKKEGDVITIGGIVYIEGGLQMNKQGSNKTFTYSGKGSILATGNIDINTNLLSIGANSYPTSNIIGVMTPTIITFNEANIDVMGIFYAENTITSSFQTDVVGTFMSNYLNMGTNVPSIYQVPSVTDNLPPGMIAREPIWVIRTIGWQEVEE